MRNSADFRRIYGDRFQPSSIPGLLSKRNLRKSAILDPGNGMIRTDRDLDPVLVQNARSFKVHFCISILLREQGGTDDLESRTL
jgi:hypothetical protein